ncbi:MAG: hypothetical protein ABFE01_01810 [Phycisphaerales bacterium]
MAAEVRLTSYDAKTRRYVAELTVTETDASVRTYTCEGTWQEGTESMIAGALYDQHKAYLAEQQAKDAERAAIEAKITDEVAKQAAVKAEGK